MDKIPLELKQLKQWVVWRHEIVNDKKTKVPYDCKTGKRASSMDKNTWNTYKEVVEYKNKAGVGFVVTEEDKYTWIDLDNCVKDGRITDEAMKIVKEMETYTEYSPSGTGLHLICIGKKKGSKCKKIIEMYDDKRFLCMTGNIYEKYDAINERQERLDALYDSYFPAEETHNFVEQVDRHTALTDAEIIEKAEKSTNGDKFKRLFEGDWKSDYPSQSEADQGFCVILAFWTNKNKIQIDRIFRQSGLYRKKWDRPDYRETTIDNAILLTRETYIAKGMKEFTDKKAETETTALQLTEEHIKILKDHKLLRRIVTEVNKNHVGEKDSIMALTCASFTGKVKNVKPESQNDVVTGETGIGKDGFVYAVLKVIAPDSIEWFVKVTSEFLAYYKSKDKSWDWDNKILVIEDPTTDFLKSNTLKVFLSGRKEKKGGTVDHGKAKILHVKGKPVVFVTTAETEINNESIRRLPCITLDKSRKLTITVKKRLSQEADGTAQKIEPDEKLIQALKFLEPYNVIIPFSQCLDDKFPDSVLMRTYYSRFLDYIKASAVLHQYQRYKTKDGWLIAEGEDYELARITFMKTVSNKGMISLSSEQQRVLEYINDHPLGVFRYDIIEQTGIERHVVDSTISLLIRNGVITALEEENERAHRKTAKYSAMFLTEFSLPVWNEILKDEKYELVTNWSTVGRPGDLNLASYRSKNEKKFWSNGPWGVLQYNKELRKKYFNIEDELLITDDNGKTVLIVQYLDISSEHQATPFSTGEEIDRVDLRRPTATKWVLEYKKGD